ncbi:hypothetical protein QTV43_000404 [Vibrio vulnificus]|nr:hypothetical protein [Vibrio vulnificus]
MAVLVSTALFGCGTSLKSQIDTPEVIPDLKPEPKPEEGTLTAFNLVSIDSVNTNNGYEFSWSSAGSNNQIKYESCLKISTDTEGDDCKVIGDSQGGTAMVVQQPGLLLPELDEYYIKATLGDDVKKSNSLTLDREEFAKGSLLTKNAEPMMVESLLGDRLVNKGKHLAASVHFDSVKIKDWSGTYSTLEIPWAEIVPESVSTTYDLNTISNASSDYDPVLIGASTLVVPIYSSSVKIEGVSIMSLNLEDSTSSLISFVDSSLFGLTDPTNGIQGFKAVGDDVILLFGVGSAPNYLAESIVLVKGEAGTYDVIKGGYPDIESGDDSLNRIASVASVGKKLFVGILDKGVGTYKMKVANYEGDTPSFSEEVVTYTYPSYATVQSEDVGNLVFAPTHDGSKLYAFFSIDYDVAPEQVDSVTEIPVFLALESDMVGLPEYTPYMLSVAPPDGFIDGIRNTNRFTVKSGAGLDGASISYMLLADRGSYVYQNSSSPIDLSSAFPPP